MKKFKTRLPPCQHPGHSVSMPPTVPGGRCRLSLTFRVCASVGPLRRREFCGGGRLGGKMEKTRVTPQEKGGAVKLAGRVGKKKKKNGGDRRGDQEGVAKKLAAGHATERRHPEEAAAGTGQPTSRRSSRPRRRYSSWPRRRSSS